MKRTRIWAAGILAAGLVTGNAEAATPDPLVEFLFEDGLTNSGTLGGAGVFVEKNGAEPELTAEGAGLGGGTAMDNTSVGSMAASGGYLKLVDDDRLDGMQSFSIALWYQPQGNLALNTRFVSKRDSSLRGFEFYVLAADRTGCFAGDDNASGNWTSSGSPNSELYPPEGRWIFAAVTWDVPNQAVTFYVAKERGELVSLTPAGAPSARERAGFDTVSDLVIGAGGAYSLGNNAFDGLLDNIRIWGSTNDASGALSYAQIKACYLEDDPDLDPAAGPVLELLFDNDLSNSGSIGGTAAFITNNAVVPTFTTDTGGVSGKSGDYAMDNTSVPVPGGDGGYCRFFDSRYLDGFTSMTIMYWYKIGSVNVLTGDVSRVLGKRRLYPGYESHTKQNEDDTLWLYVGDNNDQWGWNSKASETYGLTNTWLFNAQTYDSTAAGDEAHFYLGIAGARTLAAAASVGLPSPSGVGSNDVYFVVGSGSATPGYGKSAFDGRIDSVRVFGSYTDGGGALSEGEITRWFLADQRFPAGTVITVR
ncbi:MAG: LamG domain-containing protein [Lentisphaerae bacterium]|nr:LamG domain-containing protein [Lentisphaerota bacterium]